MVDVPLYTADYREKPARKLAMRFLHGKKRSDKENQAKSGRNVPETSF
jgi:hypothetical protein